MRYCGYCGFTNDDDAHYCGKCGRELVVENTESNPREDSIFVDRLSNYVGSNKPVDLNWKVLFSSVLKKHTKEEAEEIFICGTKTTTPPVTSVSESWPHPWLYSRVLLVMVVVFALLYICVVSFGNTIALPGLMSVGAFAMPIATLVLFFEMNAFRDVSIFEIAMTFLVGGCASMVLTLFLFTIFDVKQLDFIGAFTVGFVEELGKAIIIYYFISRLENSHVLSGLLVGAAVGAGFAAFETAGYVLFSGAQGFDSMLGTIILRGVLTPGGHVAWAAISGAAIVLAKKEDQNIGIVVFFKAKFLRLFIIPIIFHGLWDSPISSICSDFFLIPILLTICIWVMVLAIFNIGLSEVSSASEKNLKNCFI